MLVEYKEERKEEWIKRKSGRWRKAEREKGWRYRERDKGKEKKRKRRDDISLFRLLLYCPPFSAGPSVYIASVKVSGQTLEIPCKDICLCFSKSFINSKNLQEVKE